MSTNPTWMTWTGRIMSALAGLGLIASATMKLTQNPEAVKGFAALGFPDGALTPIGVAELGAAILFLIPQTSTLGAILVAGYLGGAICTHVNAGEGFAAPLILAIIAWGGLWMREPRLRALLPLRSAP